MSSAPHGAWDAEKMRQMRKHADDRDTGSWELSEALDEIDRLRISISEAQAETKRYMGWYYRTVDERNALQALLDTPYALELQALLCEARPIVAVSAGVDSYDQDLLSRIDATLDKNPNDQAGSAKAAGAPGAELTAAPTNPNPPGRATSEPSSEDSGPVGLGPDASRSQLRRLAAQKGEPAPDFSDSAVTGRMQEREPTIEELREGVKAFQHAWAGPDALADWRAFYRTVRAAMARNSSWLDTKETK